MRPSSVAPLKSLSATLLGSTKPKANSNPSSYQLGQLSSDDEDLVPIIQTNKQTKPAAVTPSSSARAPVSSHSKPSTALFLPSPSASSPPLISSFLGSSPPSSPQPNKRKFQDEEKKETKTKPKEREKGLLRAAKKSTKTKPSPKKRKVSSGKVTEEDSEGEDDDDDDEEYNDSDDSFAPANKKTSRKSMKPSKSSSSSSSSSAPKKVFADPSSVLKKVLDLGKQEENKRNDETTLTLSDLNLPNVKLEVANMKEIDVRKQIEQIVVITLNSILRGDGYQYIVPSRASNNQLYVPEIDRFVLKDKVSQRIFASIKNGRKTTLTSRVMQLVYELCCKKIHVTKRDLFYTDVKLFQQQQESDGILEDVACMVGCTRSSLNVVASEKGIVVGRIKFYDDNDLIDASKMGVGGKAIPPSIDRVSGIQGDAKFVLLVEKDAAFMRLAEDRFYNKYPCVIITGKGQPDVATRLFVKAVKEALKIPVLALMDSDPYGLKILSVFVTGSKNMSYDSANLTTADIKWLGVRPSDLDKYNIPEQCRLPLSEHDIKYGKELLKEDFITKNPKWEKELKLMIDRKEKAEIQAMSSQGLQFLTQVYLPLKIQEGDWI